jgi:hypothetical protein
MPLRSVVRQPNRNILVHGLFHCGRMFADFMSGDGWNFRYFPDEGISNLTKMAGYLKSSDLAYQIGGRLTVGKFLFAARLMEQQKIVVHWVGSDAVDYRPIAAKSEAAPWIVQKLHHWGVSKWMVEEVAALGVPCELVPLPSSRVPDSPSPLPAKFSVLVYVPDIRRGDLYGLDRILQVARELPEVSFELVGLTYGTISDAPKNLRTHGRVADLTSFYQQACVIWRPVRHDGMSHMVLEALGHGRHVLWSYPFPGCEKVSEVTETREHILRFYEQHQRGRLQINWEGVEAIANGYRPEQLKQNILVRLEQILNA